MKTFRPAIWYRPSPTFRTFSLEHLSEGHWQSLCTASVALLTWKQGASRCKSWPRNRGDIFLQFWQTKKSDRLSPWDKSVRRVAGKVDAKTFRNIRSVACRNPTREDPTTSVQTHTWKSLKRSFASIVSLPLFVAGIHGERDTMHNLLVCSKLHARGQCYLYFLHKKCN